jgi:isoquinoline 1-oxidoreductase beta subunit
VKVSRRKFVIGTGIVGSGLIIGFSLSSKAPVPHTREGSFQPNAFLQITSENEVILQLNRYEMGQGVYSSIPVLIGEELDYEPASITTEFAGVYADFAVRGTQLTGGSTSIATAWEPVREAGATARAMLIKAGAQQWEISERDCTTSNGMVDNKITGEQLSYGELASAAGNLTVPSDITLKNPEDYQWIGRELPRHDAKIKSDGTAVFGVDVQLPGLKTAVIVRPPHFGGSVKNYDASQSNNSSGVIKVLPVHSGIAVVAETYWQAQKAAKLLTIEWDKGPLAGLDSDKILNEQKRALLGGEKSSFREEGDIGQAWGQAAKIIEAEYFSPYTHHSPMEPQNCTALIDGDNCEIWAPNQGPDLVRSIVAHFTGIAQEKISVNTTFMGGSFGRRGYMDFAGEVAAIAQQMPTTPIKLIWSREDDMQHDFYRPSSYHGTKGALDIDGNILAWQHDIVTASIIEGFAPEIMSTVLPAWIPSETARDIGKTLGGWFAGKIPINREGMEIAYKTPNLMLNSIYHDPGIPIGFWRSVGHSHNAFVTESFVDELAHAANADPVKFRLRHLKDHPRHTDVLRLATDKANWNDAPEGIYQGVAVHESFLSFAAMVIEVSIKNNNYEINRVVAAVDCGRAVNPDIIRSQVESAIIYGLGAATKAAVLIEDGAVVQSNFHDLPVLRMSECPLMEVYIVDSEESPTGIGEISLPPVAPALANAIFKATGQRLREMPLRLS